MSTTPLKLHWLATFTDGSQLKQFDNDKENLFRQVLDRQNNLRYFSLYHTEKDLKFRVDLKLGIIYINERQIPEAELLSNADTKSKKKRIIYFRRITKELNSFRGTVSVTNTTVLYFLGYQYLDKNGHNRKKLIQINETGDVIV